MSRAMSDEQNVCIGFYATSIVIVLVLSEAVLVIVIAIERPGLNPQMGLPFTLPVGTL